MRVLDTNEQQDYEVYFCTKPLNLYITLLLINNKSSKKRSVIVLNAYNKAMYEFFTKFTARLKKDGYLVVCSYRDRLRNMLGLEIWNNHKQYQEVAHIFGEKIKHRFVLYNFAWNMQYVYSSANVFFKKSKEVYFIEEGVFLPTAPAPPKWKVLIKKLNGTVRNYPNQSKLKAIFAEKPSTYPRDWQLKLSQYTIHELLVGLSGEEKMDIAAAFLRDDFDMSIFNTKGDKGIVYTQPLSEDSFVTEEQKISYYKSIVEYYSKYGYPFLKLHPRDLSKYTFEGDYIVLPPYFPSELLSMLNVHFKYAVSICSSAVFNSDADYKINLNDNFLTDREFGFKEIC